MRPGLNAWIITRTETAAYWSAGAWTTIPTWSDWCIRSSWSDAAPCTHSRLANVQAASTRPATSHSRRTRRAFCGWLSFLSSWPAAVVRYASLPSPCLYQLGNHDIVIVDRTQSWMLAVNAQRLYLVSLLVEGLLKADCCLIVLIKLIKLKCYPLA